MSDYTVLHEPIIPLVRLLLQNIVLRNGAAVLDLASGSGAKLPLLREAFGDAQIIALDCDRDALRGAKRDGVTVVAGNAHSLPIRDESCDLVVCIAALGLFANQLSALREMRRVLRSDGSALLVTAEQRWAHSTPWPAELAELFAALPPANSDQADDAERLPLAAGFASATTYAVPLATAHDPISAALALCDLAQVTALTVRLPHAVRLACEAAAAHGEIELCDMCLTIWARKI